MSVRIPPQSYPWLVVAMLWAIACFNYADRQAVFSVFPLLEKEFGLSSVQLGLLGSSFAWAYGLSGPVAGMVVDRIQRRTAVLIGLQVWSSICALTALAVTFPQLVFFRAAEGLGETIYFPGSMSLISDYHGPRTRSRAMGLHQTSVYIGTIAGGYFAGKIGQIYGWRWSFVIFGGLGMALGVLLFRALKEPSRGALEGGTQSRPAVSVFFRTLLKTPAALLLMFAFLCSNFVAVVLLTWMPKYIHDAFHFDLAMSGLTATLYVQLASLVGAIAGGWLADMWRKRTVRGRIAVQLLGVLGGAPFVLLCGATASVTWLIVALTAWGLFKGLYDANIWASLFDVVAPEFRGTAVGVMNALGWLAGGGSAPLAIGWVATKTGLGAAIGLASAVYLAAAAFLIGAMFMMPPAKQEAQ
jgi:MFS family permease